MSNHKKTMSDRIRDCDGLTKQDWVRQKRFLLVLAIWGGCFVTSTYLFSSTFDLSSTTKLMLIGITGLAMVAAFVAYANFLRHADELTQKVQLYGIAPGFAAGLLFTMLDPMLEQAGLDFLDPSWAFMGICVVTTLGMLRARRKFQ